MGAEITDGAALEAALREVAPEPVEQAGLADAIADPGPAENYSAAGYQRIEALGRELAALRERSGQPLTELVADVERTIGVGVETQARGPGGGGGGGAPSRAPPAPPPRGRGGGGGPPPARRGGGRAAPRAASIWTPSPRSSRATPPTPVPRWADCSPS